MNKGEGKAKPSVSRRRRLKKSAFLDDMKRFIQEHGWQDDENELMELAKKVDAEEGEDDADEQ